MKITEMNVELLDYMGTDLTIANAARVSFDKESDWEKVPKDPAIYGDDEGTYLALSARDTKLIGYLAKHKHWSPFAHTSIQLRIKAPIFVARQLVKHQVGLVWNEVSRRYVDSEPEFWFPEQWRGRPEGSMKQGSSGVVTEGEPQMWAKHAVAEALDKYKWLLEHDVAPEQARMILPQNTMTEWWWTGSLMAFTRVCKQRLDAHAQQETREIAERIAEVVAPLFPVSWSALMSGNM